MPILLGFALSIHPAFLAAQNKTVNDHALNLEHLIQPSPNSAGDTACVKCHETKTTSFHLSAHARTSALPSATSIKGNFQAGKNILSTVDPNASFRMEEKKDGYFETASITTPTKTFSRTERIDLVIGSGRKGQTYLYWNEALLFELPVSSWTSTGEWTNSPGYPDGTANFDRGVSDRCLECHTTSFKSLSPPRNRFSRSDMVLGITCQKCHGPSEEHVKRYSAAGTGARTTESALVNPGKFSRQQQMDLCSLCHAGVGKAVAPPLSYQSGDSLNKSLIIAPAAPGAHVDPHGSQVQTLTQSRCYQSSQTLTCMTCHDVHTVQKKPAELAASCLVCHQVESCGKFSAVGQSIAHKCIDCHMPLETTDKIVMRINGQRYQPQVRNHRIGIYPESSEAVSAK